MGARGTIRLALAFALLLASLTLVVWRQSRAMDELRRLDLLRSERAVLESQRAALLSRIQVLESRSRIVGLAGDWLGMRVPTAEEIVILLRGDSAGAKAVAAEAATVTGGGAGALAASGERD